jgi:predicted Rossmann fold nucleotide-binding protein DprA/Smf involved in DNA uptake
MKAERLDWEALDSGAQAHLRRVLREADLPPVLHHAGNLDLLGGTLVSVAGSRSASGWSTTAIEALAGLLATGGGTIVSGGAVGTDVAGHRGALQVGGRTIVVPPVSLDQISLEHWRGELRGLWDMGRVLFLTPFGPRDRVTRSSPIIRNRLIAALGLAAVVGQTRLQSGTNHFLGVSRRLRRPVFMLVPPEGDHDALDPRTAALPGVRLFAPAEALEARLAAVILDAARASGQSILRFEAATPELFADGDVAP